MKEAPLGWVHILIVVLGIGLMLLLNIKWKVNAMLALLLAALFIGFAEMLGTGTPRPARTPGSNF